MRPDDPRHGTYAGYGAGCRQDCCRTAARNYHKRRAYEGRPRLVSSVGLRRRVQALACLGWSMYDLANKLGVSRENVRQWMLHDEIHRTTHDTMCRLYDELSMTLAPTRTPDEQRKVSKVRNKALSSGWLPPLAWDEDSIDVLMDIENITNLRFETRRHDRVDPVVVERVIAGDTYLRTTRAEREEIAHRWHLMGRSAYELAHLTGWKVERYYKQGGAA